MEAKKYDLTGPQKSIYLLEKFYSGTNLNSLCGSSIVRTNIDFDVLKKAINIIIENNDSFRLHFIQENNEIKQYVADYKYVDIEIIDIPDEAHVQDIENLMLQKKFDIFSCGTNNNLNNILDNNLDDNLDNDLDNDLYNNLEDLFEFKIFRFPNGYGGFSLHTHHLLGDSWSLGLVTKSVVNTYNNLINSSELSCLKSSYTDFCINEKDYFTSEKCIKDKSYWADIFKTVPEVASIPSQNKSVTPSISCKANRSSFVFEKELVDNINNFCKENKVSVFNFLMAVYSLYISRVSGLDDFVIGTPILNRTNFTEKNTMGMFINTMPLRISTKDLHSFNELVSDIAVKSMAMLRHQRYSYEFILDDLRRHNPNVPNLYNILLSYQITKMTIDGVDCDTRWAFNGNCSDELQIHILDFNNAGSLLVSYDYRDEKYCEQEICELHNRILHIIHQILSISSGATSKTALDSVVSTNGEIAQDSIISTNIDLKNIEIVTPEEKNKIINLFNDTHFEYDYTKNICQLFEEQVLKTPNNTAVVFENCSLTYKELNNMANQLANYLLNFNLKPESVVGVLMNRSLELIISLIAVLKCGYTYVPIDPDYPEDRIRYMLEDSKSSMVLANSKTIQILRNYALYNEDLCKNGSMPNISNVSEAEFISKPKSTSEPEFIEIRFSKKRKTITINVDEVMKRINNNDILTNINKNISLFSQYENLNFAISPSTTMYLIYTSGSTGKPKGVMITHKNVHNFILGMKNKIDFNPNKTIVSVTTISFDIFGLELWCGLTSGMKIVIANEFEQNNSDLLNKLCLKNNVNIIQTTPSRYNMLLNGSANKNDELEIGKNPVNIEFMKNITDLLIGGESVPITLLHQLQHLTNAHIYNVYGPTETTIWSTIKDITNDSTISIGNPIANTKCYILDDSLNLLPPYTPGNLYIGGDGVSKGYLNKNELTCEKFIKSPFDNNCSIIYNTNDLAYFTDTGDIVHLGRSDSQVKYKGYRIELGEIENVISKFDKISSCAVVIKNENLCVFYTTKGISNISISELKHYVLSNLPSYMMPSAFYKLEKMPFTSNGKISRKSLEVPKNIETRNIVLPKNDFEEKIFSLIAKISNNSDFSMDDDFFAIGLDSINIISLALEISNLFNVNISSREIISCQSVLNLVSILQSKMSSNTGLGSNKMSFTKTSTAPLSSAQKRIYYASKMSKNPLLYNVSGGLLIDKLLDENKIKNIFNKLIQIHSSFRTCFKLVDGVPHQFILDDITLDINVITTSENVDIQQIVDNFPKEFNFEEAPLLRVAVYFINTSKTLILLDSHHIILDGTSLNILVSEFCSLYNNAEIAEEFIKETTSCINYSLLEQDFINSNNINIIEEYWVNQFKDTEIPVISLPYDSPIVSKNKTFNGNKLVECLPKDVFDKICVLAKQFNVSPYVMFLSAFYLVLHRYTGQENIVVGSATTGREGFGNIANDNLIDNFDIQNTIGMFTNNIPLLANINSNNEFMDFVLSVKNTVLEALANQPYPYDMLVKALNLEPTTSLFDVMFIYQNENSQLPNVDGSKLTTLYANTKTSKFNLSLEIIPNEYTVNLEYNTDLFNEATVCRILDSYMIVLNNIINNPTGKIKDINILSDNQIHKVLYDFNNTNLDYDENVTMAELFENQVLKTPDEIALVFETEQFTYKELNEKANQLAHFIRNKNIGRNDIIGIMLPRSPELIISILAAFKAGCCYIPIDPKFPDERIRFMLDNSNSKVLLTSKSLFKKLDFENKVIVNLDNSEIYFENIAVVGSANQITEIQTTAIQTNANLEKITMPDDNSYIIYTSGSTGKPKGVVLKQKSLTNLACYLNNTLEFFIEPKNTVMASITTSSFDIFLFETIMCLQAGVKVILANEDEQHIPSKLNKLIERNNVTSIQMTPSRMQFFVDNLRDIPALAKLEYVTLAGEPLSENLKNELLNIGVRKVYNGYGPSETTVFSTFTDVTNHNLITIGKGVGNTQLYILDNDLTPCPIGVPGELYISGDGVGNGYLNNKDLTDKSYISNPFVPNTVMYKVGDLCKFLENGEVVCLGRVDNQIKVRGLRIELGEIENKILEFPFIEKCVVVKQSVNNREFISAYYIAKKRINKSELRGYLAKALPNYMIPSYFTSLDSFPQTPNGKIDKKSLPLPKIAKNEFKEYIAPSTQLEITLVNIFEKILSISPIGLTDNFFELGGDSILAMSLNIELLKITDKITYADIFNNPTVFDLVEFINSQQKNESIVVSNDNGKYSGILDKNKIVPQNLNTVNEIFDGYKISNSNASKPCNLLLTGATGFLGIHILEAYLKNTFGKIYCIVRDEPGISAEIKLLNKLHYYFGNIYDDCINTRVFVIHGDMCKSNLGLSDSDYNFLADEIDVVINSAAKVAHFGKYEDFYKINVESVKNLVDFCNHSNSGVSKRFYQISTLSVSGNSFVDSYSNVQTFNENRDFEECDFNIGQTLNNVYIRTKYEAEEVVLDSILNNCNSYILRVGNLMPRFSDGVFQENVSENAYLNRLSAFVQLGIIPESISNSYLEFTPIDFCADAVVKIIQNSNENNRVFHLFNHNHIYLNKLLEFLNNLNYNMDIVETSEFKNVIKNLLNDDSKKHVISHLSNDFGKDLSLNYESNIKIKSDFTIEFLKNLNFEWPTISIDYIEFILKIINRK